jgi:hypothetical protein
VTSTNLTSFVLLLVILKEKRKIRALGKQQTILKYTKNNLGRIWLKDLAAYVGGMRQLKI